MADAGFRKVYELTGNAGLFHDVAAEDEERDRQKYGLAGCGGDKLRHRAEYDGDGAPRAHDQHGCYA